MDFKQEIERSRMSYLDEWSYSSQLYYELGYYDLLAEAIPDNSSILEIGTGAGHSTISIARKAKKIVSVDENVYCLRETQYLLEKNNFKANKIERGTLTANDKFYSYKTNYNEIEVVNDSEINLVESDILADNSFITFLERNFSFDVITCWLIGAHGLVLNEEEQIKKGRNGLNRQPYMVQDYKFDVVKKIGALSDKLLNEGGFIYIVDRLDMQKVKQFPIETILDMYKEKYDNFNLVLDDYALREVITRSKMQMINPEKVHTDSTIGLFSLMFKKNCNSC